MNPYFGNLVIKSQGTQTEKNVSERGLKLPPAAPPPRHGFCDSCLRTTANEYVDRIFYGVAGAWFLGRGDRCPRCGSVVQRVWFCFILPIFPMTGPYRVIYLNGGSRGKYLSRRVLNEEDARRLVDPEGVRASRLRRRMVGSAVFVVVALVVILMFLKTHGLM